MCDSFGIYTHAVECMSLALRSFSYILAIKREEGTRSYLYNNVYTPHRVIYRPVYPYSQNLIIPDNNNLVLLIWLLTIYVFKVYSLSYNSNVSTTTWWWSSSGNIEYNACSKRNGLINFSIYILSLLFSGYTTHHPLVNESSFRPDFHT